MRNSMKQDHVRPEDRQPRVGDLMTTEVFTLTPEDSLRALKDLLAAKKIRHVPVTDEFGRLLGLVTQRDFLTVAVSKFAHLDQAMLDEIYSKIRVGEIMGRKVSTATPSTPLGEAATTMVRHKHGCMPVIQDGHLVGIITEADFVKAFARAYGD